MVGWRDVFRRLEEEEENPAEETPVQFRPTTNPRRGQDWLHTMYTQVGQQINFRRLEEQEVFYGQAVNTFHQGDWVTHDEFTATLTQPKQKEKKDMIYKISLEGYPEGYMQFFIKHWGLHNGPPLPIRELTNEWLILSKASMDKIINDINFGCDWENAGDNRIGQPIGYSRINTPRLSGLYMNLPEQDIMRKVSTHFVIDNIAVNNVHGNVDPRDRAINYGTSFSYINKSSKEAVLNLHGKEVAVNLHNPSSRFLERYPNRVIVDSNKTPIAFYIPSRQRLLLLFNPFVGDILPSVLEHIFKEATEITGSPEMYTKEMQEYIGRGTKAILAESEASVESLRTTQKELESRLKSTYDTLQVNVQQLNAYRSSFTVGIDVERIVKEINNNKNVKAFKINNDHLKFRTGPLEYEYDNVVYALGEFNVDVELESSVTKITNTAQSAHPYDHPHVRGGNPCWGNTPPLIEAFSKGEFGMGIDILIRFLESVNVGDVWGCSIVRFPIKEIKGDITEKTHDVMLQQLYEYDRDAYRDVQEGGSPKKEILARIYPDHFPQLGV